VAPDVNDRIWGDFVVEDHGRGPILADVNVPPPRAEIHSRRTMRARSSNDQPTTHLSVRVSDRRERQCGGADYTNERVHVSWSGAVSRYAKALGRSDIWSRPDSVTRQANKLHAERKWTVGVRSVRARLSSATL
jgi:hypothetical protein